MFELQSLLSIVRQLARVIPSPKEQLARRARTKASLAGDCCGLCPRCRAFVAIEFQSPGAPTPCPRCRRPIKFVEPLERP